MELRFRPGMFGLALIFLVLCGCMPPKVKVAVPETPPVRTVPVFSPQKAMETGDYEGFLAENQKKLEECTNQNATCEEALFNLAFLYAYPKSPYYSQSKAIKHLNELVGKFPNTLWAYQAQVWIEMLKRASASESARRRMQNDLQTEIKSKDDALTEKDAAINDLQEQLKRSRDIDLEIEKRERQLLKK